MPLFLKENKVCLFVHVPKTGGSSLEEAAVRSGWTELLSIRGMHPRKLRCFRSTPQHFHASILEAFLDVSRLHRVLLICRDPFERIKSEYYWQVQQSMATDSPRAWFERVMFEARKNMWVYDNHLRFQHEFVLKGADTRHFKLEHDGVREALAYMNDGRGGELPSVEKLKKSTHDYAIEQEFLTVRDDIKEEYYEDYDYFGYET